MPAASRPVVEEEARSWKNGYYFELGDQELRLIVWKAESINDSYEFSDGKIRPYKPISNLLWKEMTRKKRQLLPQRNQSFLSLINDLPTSLYASYNHVIK